VRGREGILRVHTKRTPLNPDVDLEIIGRGTPGFSGADLENLVNEAALLAARQDKEALSMGDFELAKDKVMMGAERRSMIISEHEKRTTAWHEAGHTLVARMLPNHDPVHKVSIIPRGPALGVTMSLPKEDRLGYSRDWACDRIAMALGGRIAEQLKFGQLTTGASNDFKQASQLAKAMVTEWGMSEKLGPVSYNSSDENPMMPFGPSGRSGDYSEQTAQEIDTEIRSIINEQYARARKICEENIDKLNAIAEALLEKETLDSEDLDAIMEGRPMSSRERVVIPTYADKRNEAREKRKGSIFQPRPREVPSGG
jgi:cell division protease FtsH